MCPPRQQPCAEKGLKQCLIIGQFDHLVRRMPEAFAQLLFSCCSAAEHPVRRVMQDGAAANFLHPLSVQTAAALEARWVAHRSQHPDAAAESVPVMFGRRVELSAEQVLGRGHPSFGVAEDARCSASRAGSSLPLARACFPAPAMVSWLASAMWQHILAPDDFLLAMIGCGWCGTLHLRAAVQDADGRCRLPGPGTPLPHAFRHRHPCHVLCGEHCKSDT